MSNYNPFEPEEIDRSGLSELFSDIEVDSNSSLGDIFNENGSDSQTNDNQGTAGDETSGDSKDTKLDTVNKKGAAPKPFKAGSAVRTKAIPAGVVEDPDASIVPLQENSQSSNAAAQVWQKPNENKNPSSHTDTTTDGENSRNNSNSSNINKQNEKTNSTGGERDFSTRERDTQHTAHSDGQVAQEWNLAKSSEAALDRRYTDGDRLWPIVDRVMSVAGSDPQIQSLAGKLELINNSELDKLQKDEILEALKPKLGAAGIVIPDPNDIVPVLQMAYDELVGISVLGPIWRDPEITEIMVDRWDIVTVERHGRLENTPIKFRDPEHANSVARSLALRVSDRAVSRTINLVTAELPSARVQFAYGPVVKGGLSITIRKFRDLLGLKDLKNFGALDDDMEEFLKTAVLARSGILVSGGTGTGKTTIINLLSNFIPGYERVLTIEDAFEMQLSAEHVVSLQTKEASSADDAVNVTLAHLLRASLRMRPDRIIVGEIREGEGASVMLAAANTGHDGTMTTIHANSVDMALNERLVDLVRQQRSSSDEAIRRTIVNAFDLVVQVARGRKGNRYISQIAQVDKNFIHNEVIKPVIIFQGQDDAGKTSFELLNKVNPYTELGERLIALGATEWLEEDS